MKQTIFPKLYGVLLLVMIIAGVFLFLPEDANAAYVRVRAYLNNSEWGGGYINISWQVSGYPRSTMDTWFPSDFYLGSEFNPYFNRWWTFYHNYGGPPGAQFSYLSPQSVYVRSWSDVTVRYYFTVPAPSVSISADSTNIAYNSATIIRWSSNNTTSCNVTPNNWPGTYGSQSTGNLTSSRTYTATCYNSIGQSDSKSVTVNVAAQPTGTGWIRATLDGQPWSGTLYAQVKVDGYFDWSLAGWNALPVQYTGLPANTWYRFRYSSGGPANATFTSITPSQDQYLCQNCTITFTFNFITTSRTVNFSAKIANIGGVDANTSSANLTVTPTVTGASRTFDISSLNKNGGSQSVSHSWSSPPGSYSAELCADKPPPSPGAISESDEANNCAPIPFNVGALTGSASIIATLDGQSWSGTISGGLWTNCGNNNTPWTSSVPVTVSPIDSSCSPIRLSYTSGGPPGASFQNITPSPSQNLNVGGSITFTYNFVYPALSASCSVSPTSANIGQTVTWSASASGGTGSYTYSWSGTDGLSGSSQSVQKSYSSSGTKTGSVSVTSGSQTVNQSCSNSVIITAPAPTADIKANGSNGPITIPYNQPATISWSSTNASSCSVSPSGWSGTSGSQSTGNLTSSRTYSLNCSGTGGSASDSVTVNVSPPPPVITSFGSSPSSIPGGGSSTLSWSSSNAASCTINQGIGSVPTSGSRSVSPATTTTYTLICDTASAQTTVMVLPQCSDGIDNDGDTKIDYPSDKGCTDASDNDETGEQIFGPPGWKEVPPE